MAKSQTATPKHEVAALERPTARRLTPKGEATRARLIEIAAELFAEEGYAAVSIRDVATRSGLSSGAIYGTFRGKADLLAEVVDASLAADVETLPVAVREMTLPDIDAYQYEHADARARLRGLLLEAAAAARSDPDIRERISEAMAPRIDLATDAHEEWRERAGVDPSLDMRALVTMIWSADLGLEVLRGLGVEMPDLKTWSDLMRRLLHSLESPNASPGAPSPRETRRRKA
jgi:AcrR family transcriptional regulator